MPRTNPEYTLELSQKQANTWVFKLHMVLFILYSGSIAWSFMVIKTGSCEHGSPAIADLSAVAFTFSLVLWQLVVCCPSSTSCGASVVLTTKALVGMLESLDFFTNMQQLSHSVLCDDVFHERWVSSFENGAFPFPYLAPVVEAMHLSGLLAISIAVRRLFMSWHAYSEGHNTFSMITRLTGFHSLRHVMGADHVYTSAWEDYVYGLLHFFTDLPIMLLQTVLFAQCFGAVNDLAKYEQLFSIALSAWALLHHSVGVVTLKAFKQLGSLKVLFYVLLIVYLCSVTSLRTYFAFQCEDHVWTIVDGCVWNSNWNGVGQRTVLPPCIYKGLSNFEWPDCALKPAVAERLL